MNRISRFVKGMRLLFSKVTAMADEQRLPIGEAVSGIKLSLSQRPNATSLSQSHGLICSQFENIDFLLLGNLDDVIERRLAYDGVWEPHLLRHALALLTPHSLCVDVGANVGAISIPLAKRGISLGVQVLSVEANTRLAHRLRCNAALNHLSNLTVVACAAAKEAGVLRFYQTLPTADNQGISSLIPTLPESERVEVTVQAMPLDALVATHYPDLPVCMIKIDVEGAELEVLEGARHVINHHRPALLFEVLPQTKPEDDVRRSTLHTLLEGYGYRFYSLSDSIHHFQPAIDLTAGFSGDVLAVCVDGPQHQTVGRE